jgi:hypothetical protein
LICAPLLVDRLDHGAWLVVGLHAQQREHGLDVALVLARLVRVVGEVPLELLAVRLVVEPAEHLQHVALHREGRPELVVEQLARRLEPLEQHVALLHFDCNTGELRHRFGVSRLGAYARHRVACGDWAAKRPA